MNETNWTPVANGDIYCSTRCGYNCTKAQFDAAVQDADNLVARLGSGWKPRIWENLGWHYSAVKGIAKVHPSSNGEYMAFINSTIIQTTDRDLDPNVAVEKAVDELRRMMTNTAGELAVLGNP